MSSSVNSLDIVPQRLVRPSVWTVEPGHWKKQLPKKYLDLAQRGDVKGLAVLLQEHPDFLSKRGSHNRTLLWEAARSGKLSAVQMLVDLGADVNATGCYNRETFVQITPFCAARHYRREAIAEYLATHGSTTDIFRAAFLGNRGLVELELASHPDMLTAEDPHDDIYFVPLLSFAVAGGHADLTEALIRHGADVAQYSEQLLGLAARQSRQDLIQMLLTNGAEPRAVGPGIFATVSDLHFLEYLLSIGVSPRGRAGADSPPLVYVARGDKGERPDKVQLLLDHGADVNAAGSNGKTALHYAATAGHGRVVSLLLDRGADTSRADNDGQTALTLARRAGKLVSTELLETRGAT